MEKPGSDKPGITNFSHTGKPLVQENGNSLAFCNIFRPYITILAGISGRQELERAGGIGPFPKIREIREF